MQRQSQSQSQTAVGAANNTSKKVDYAEWKAFLQQRLQRKAPQALIDKIKNIPSALQHPKASSL